MRINSGGKDKVKLEGIDEQFMLYGMIFSLCNRIQTIGDGQFEDITMKQHFLMVVLSIMGEEAPTLKETGEVMGCSYQNVKRMALQLEKKGYLKIIQDEKDKRKQRLVMTEKMVRFGEAKKAATKVFMQTMYRGIEKEEISRTIKILTKINHNLGGVIE